VAQLWHTAFPQGSPRAACRTRWSDGSGRRWVEPFCASCAAKALAPHLDTASSPAQRRSHQTRHGFRRGAGPPVRHLSQRAPRDPHDAGEAYGAREDEPDSGNRYTVLDRLLLETRSGPSAIGDDDRLPERPSRVRRPPGRRRDAQTADRRCTGHGGDNLEARVLFRAGQWEPRARTVATPRPRGAAHPTRGHGSPPPEGDVGLHRNPAMPP
jgi:hypothetical protein